jgi:hypothetical protein
MSGGAAPRRKGTRFERAVARALGGARVPLSGAAGGSWSGDVILPNGWRVECKRRAEGWRQLYAWLANADVVVVQADRQPALAVLPLARLAALLDHEVSDASA